MDGLAEPDNRLSSRKDITMRSKLTLKGSITALVTPFKNGGIDE